MSSDLMRGSSSVSIFEFWSFLGVFVEKKLRR